MSLEAALPAKAPATPRKPRRLLVFDRQGIYNGKQYGGHASIPHANLAVQLVGEKTGAFTATLSSDPAAISAANLQQYDALYLNNTVGDIFDTPEMRAAVVAFVAKGGGIVGNHGTSVASPQWTEFGEILGATGASHREPTEKATIRADRRRRLCTPSARVPIPKIITPPNAAPSAPNTMHAAQRFDLSTMLLPIPRPIAGAFPAPKS